MKVPKFRPLLRNDKDVGISLHLKSREIAMATFIGTNGNNAVQAAPNNANDVYYMLDGDDYVNSQFAGLNYIEGGRGNDLLSLGDGAVAGQSGRVSGGDGRDFIVGGQLGDDLFGEDGNDIIAGGSINNFGATGGVEFVDNALASGNDVIDGGRGSDALYGLDGDDFIFGGDGSDSGTITFTTTGTGVTPSVKGGLFGGVGNDFLDGGDGTDYLDGGDDNDILYGGRGNDAMYGGVGIDTMDGGDGIDTIYGGDGADKLIGGEAVDTFYGGNGADFINADLGNDIAYGGTDADIIYSGLSNGITAYGGDGADQLASGNVVDTLYGDAGDDILFSGLGNDFMYGGSGNDAIGGYLGIDAMYGGAGTDYFNLTLDVRAGEYDGIGDWSLTDDYLYLPAGLASVTTYTDYAGGAYAKVALGTSNYYVYVSGATAADLAVSTFFV
jgi:Ca2+-binding RTX toxin-like protein